MPSKRRVKVWLCLTDATDAPQLDLDLLELLEEAKAKVGDPGAIKMVEAAYVKLKDHLWYWSGKGRNWQMQSLNVRTKSVLIAHKCLKQKILGEKSLRQFVGLDSWTFFCTAAWEGIGILNEESSEVIN